MDRDFTKDTAADISAMSGLPHWETIPPNISQAIKEIKVALRKRITDNGRKVEDVLDEIKAFLVAEIEDIKATKARGEEVWPIIDFADIERGTVSAESIAKLQRRGCVMIRGHFDRAQAESWDADAVDYVDSNEFFQKYSGPADDFFGTLEMSKPEIYPIYWSSTQMQARQHPRMATVQQFLNSQWKNESHGKTWFDRSRYSLYPDRIRRRPPCSNSNGLGTHLDPGCLDLWMTEGYQQHFGHLFRGEQENSFFWRTFDLKILFLEYYSVANSMFSHRGVTMNCWKSRGVAKSYWCWLLLLRYLEFTSVLLWR